MLKFRRISRVEWDVRLPRSGGGWVAVFRTRRVMVPVEKIRNPFAGIRDWELRIGRLKLSWRC